MINRDKKKLICSNQYDFSSTRPETNATKAGNDRTDPFDGGGRVPGRRAAKLSPLALLDVQHGGSDGGHRLGPLSSYRGQTQQSNTETSQCKKEEKKRKKEKQKGDDNRQVHRRSCGWE